MQTYAGKDEDMIDSVYRDLVPYVLEKAWVIPCPNPYMFSMWWPWMKNYNGELSIGYFNMHNYLKYVWFDQNLKKEMGY